MTTKTKIFTRHLIRLLMAIAVSSTLLVVPSAANASANSIIDNPSRPTLIFVFQPFCYYCKRAAPFVAQLHAQLGADMDFIMVTDYADHTPFSNSFRSTFGLTMPLIEDRGLDFAKYKINGYPNFLWSVPGEGVTNWGPVGYDATAWARKDVPALLRLAKYGPPPARISTIKVGARPVVGQVDVSWSPVTAKTPISHYEVRARKSSSAPQATSKSTILGTTGDQPNGIVMDAAGNIYTTNHGDFNATDQRSNNVSKITPAGVSTIFATTGEFPYGIVMDAAGNIYTTNRYANNVSKITPAGDSATNTTQSKDEEVFGVSGVSAAIGISNATLDITYLVAVRAISPAGTGAWSEETSVSWKTSSTTATVATVKTLSRGTSLTAESIASYAKLAIKAGSVASLKVSAKSSKYCIASFGATQLLGYQVGSCTVTVTLISKTGQSTSKTVTLEVTE